MQLNIPYKVRAFLYVLTMVGTPFVMTMVDQGFMPDWVAVLWAAEVTVVSGLAAFNTVPTHGEEE